MIKLDNRQRESRTLLLLGLDNNPETIICINAFVDFICNFVYGVDFDSKFRLKIANEVCLIML